MTPYDSGTRSSWSERRRLRKFRREREHLRFSEEIKLIPQPLVTGLVALLVVAEAVCLLLCKRDIPYTWPLVEQYGRQAGMLLTAAIVLGFWLLLAIPVALLGYVYVDSRRRGMNTMGWVFLCIAMLPAYLAMGFIIYFAAREPLPYHCPRCGTLVSARYNFCPNCKTTLHPTCGFCRREVGGEDRYCPHCGNTLAPAGS